MVIEFKHNAQDVEKIGISILNKWLSMGMINTGMVGGSVRRMVALVKDLELIIRPVVSEIPDIPEQPSLFDKIRPLLADALDGQDDPPFPSLDQPPPLKKASMFEEYLEEFLALDPMITLGGLNGPKQKKFIYTMEEEPDLEIDCFIVPDPRAWGVQVVIRTGPGKTGSQAFTQPLMSYLRTIRMHTSGGLLHSHPKYQKEHHSDKRGQCKNTNCPLIIPTPTEESFFEAIGLPFIPPAARAYDTLERAVSQAMKKRKG